MATDYCLYKNIIPVEIMWQQFLCISILTRTLASDDFNKLHNDILWRITNNLRRSDNGVSDIEDNVQLPNQTQPQKIQFRLETPDHNDPQNFELHLESPATNNTSAKENGRRLYGETGLRIRDLKPQMAQNTMKIKRITTNNTMNLAYMAAVIINGRVWCAGSLVDENWVLTAAHCLNYVIHVSSLKALSRYVKVRVGSVHPHEGGRLIDVVGAVRHPKFEEEPVPHADVALLKLAVNVVFGRHINIIKIYEGVTEPFAQSFIVVSGWGATRGTDTAIRERNPDLTSGRLKVRSQHYCVDAYQLVNGFQFTPDLFCASIRKGSRDACLFDAGAPAVQHNKLMGIMSFGPEYCGDEVQPAVFIKAFYFREFVKSTISSYKTTQELIEAIRDVDPNLQENYYSTTRRSVTPIDVSPNDSE